MTENNLDKKTLSLLLLLIVGGFWLFQNSDASTKVAEKAREACAALANREQCYAKFFGTLTESRNWQESFEILRELQKLDFQARGCHFIAHSIAVAEAEKSPERWRELMNAAPPDCSYGAVHGPLEYYASTFPDGKIPESEIGTLCDNPDTRNCSHGLGHVLLVINDNDIDRSASQCEALPHDASAKFECLTGVFMERSTAVNLVTHGLAKKEALDWSQMLPETEAVCRLQTGIRAIACWKETVHVAAVALKNDPQKLVDFCQSAPQEDETRECIDHAIGILAAGFDFDLSRLSPLCETRVKTPDFKARCYPNLVSSVLSTLPQALPAARAFCAALEEKYREPCEERIENTLRYQAAGGQNLLQ